MPKKRILVSDDEQAILNSIKLVLEEEGYHVFTASDGKEALHVAMNEELDLMILDIIMPELSGREVLQHLEQEECQKDTPVIIFTAIDQGVPEREGWELNCAAYITKPFSPYAVVETVNEILGNQETAPMSD